MKSTITLVDAQGIKKPNVIEYDGLLGDWIIEHLDVSVPCCVYSGGVHEHHKIAEFSEDNLPSEEEFLRLNIHHSSVFIVSNPLGFDPISILAYAAISVATAFVSAILMPKPQMPEGTKTSRPSPNNSVGPQTNVIRAGDRVPDIFGEDRAVPDLITPGVYEFINHIKYITQDMCISRGYGLIEDVRSGETLGASIAGFQIDIFEPGQAPSKTLKSSESNEVKTLTLNPPNDSGTSLSEVFLSYKSSTTTGFIYSKADLDLSAGSQFQLEQVNTEGPVNFDGSYLCQSFTSEEKQQGSASYVMDGSIIEISGDFSGFSSFDVVYVKAKDISNISKENLDDFFVVQSADSTSIQLISSMSPSSGTYRDIEVISFKYEITSPAEQSSGWVSIDGTYKPVIHNSPGKNYNPKVVTPDQIKVRGPFVVPGKNISEVWIDTQFPRGLAYDQDKNRSVTTKTLFEEIDENDIPTGYSFEVVQTFTDNEINPRFYTTKINEETEPKFIPNRKWQVSRERTSSSALDARYQEDCQWTRLAGMENITQPDSTGTTRIQVRTQATEQTSSLQESKINLRWTKKCLTWDGKNVIGNLDTGQDLVPSRRMADNFLTYALDPKLGARNVHGIDIHTLYEIQSDLDSVFNGEKGEFGFTFSDPNTPALEEMRQIANSCRCFIYRIGSVISMVRDEANPFPGKLFNRRNKIPFAERKSIKTQKPLDFDGVQFEFKSRKDDEIKTILLPDDLPTDDPNYGAPNAKNPKVMQSTGIRNLSQAWERAQYEYNKIIYQRESIETTVTQEGILLSLNEKIEHVDGTRINRSISDGEVFGFSGLNVDTSELCLFEGGRSYVAIFRGEDGSTSAEIPVTKREDTEFGFTLSMNENLFARGYQNYQLGTLYSFYPTDEKPKSYLVQSISPNDVGDVTLELINYSDRYYYADNQQPPEDIE